MLILYQILLIIEWSISLVIHNIALLSSDFFLEFGDNAALISESSWVFAQITLNLIKLIWVIPIVLSRTKSWALISSSI